MSTIKHFLKDSYQRNLLLISQNQSERYEEALERYRDNFISEWMLIEKEEEGREKEIYEIISAISADRIGSFFDKIVEVYIKWIDTYLDQALDQLRELLEEYKLLNSTYDIRERILFRGRVDKNILTPWDMFHIPFNKRYLIENQRYSLTGQPLLYLGFSVIDILAELRRNEEEIENLKICTYTLKNSLEVYDLRNSFYKYFEYNPLEDVIDDQEVTISIDSSKVEQEFFRLILASCCSFKKRKEMNSYSFCEEYVVPQMLANVIKKVGYHGIIYTSTRLEIHDNGENYNSAYKDNVAIFTKLCRTHIYDKDLFDKFSVSNPIDFTKIQEVGFSDLQRLCDTIKIYDEERQYQTYTSTAAEMQQEIQDIEIQDKKYTEHILGKMHMYLVYSLLTEVKNSCLVRRNKNDRVSS